MSKKYDVAIVGATGAVGETLISILDQRNFPINNLYPLASKRSAGSKVKCQGRSWIVEDLDTFDFSKVKITRILDRLEGKHLVNRERRGMTNIVILRE